jgi:ABC-type transport system involved in Fe-S cluster assembly fused permease/ATPase subunit
MPQLFALSACDFLAWLQTVKLFCAESLEVSQYDAATRQYQVCGVCVCDVFVCMDVHVCLA